MKQVDKNKQEPFNLFYLIPFFTLGMFIYETFF